MPRICVASLPLMALLLAGCGAGSGVGLDLNGRPAGDNAGQPLTATLSSIQSNVFDVSCTGCHAGSAAPLGLRLDAASSFALLVNIPSSQESDARVDYVELRCAETLAPLERIDRPAVLALAVRFGKTRLIDNTTLEANR